MIEQQAFVAITDEERHFYWLKTGLQNAGEVILAHKRTLEDVLSLVEMSGAHLVFIELNRSTMQQAAALIEGLLAAKPMLAIVALGEEADSALVLAAMRAGARDYISPASRQSELAGMVRRLLESSAGARLAKAPSARMTAVYSARPDADTVMFATHLALALAERRPGKEVLLLDLGVPQGDSTDYLGATTTFSFVDAVRNLRRLDATLIDGAIYKHASGVRILAMPEDAEALGEITSAEIFLLLGTLRSFFGEVVVNLGGLPPSEFLNLLLGNSEQLFWLVEQSVPSCRQNLQSLQALQQNKVPLGSVGLVVDRYQRRQPPRASVLAKSFKLPLETVLPPSPEARLRVMNLGRSMFEVAPRDLYCRRIRALAAQLAPADAPPPDLKQRLRRLLGAA